MSFQWGAMSAGAKLLMLLLWLSFWPAALALTLYLKRQG